MQIILTEASIKEAIDQYITDMVHLPEGATLVIDLIATRGEAGHTAKIEIVRDGATRSNQEDQSQEEDAGSFNNPALAETPAQTPNPDSLGITTTVRRTRRTKAQIEEDNRKAAEAASGEAEAQTDPAAEEQAPATEAPEEDEQLPVEEEPVVAQADAEAVQEQVEEQPKPAPKSLFANLGKPQNS